MWSQLMLWHAYITFKIRTKKIGYFVLGILLLTNFSNLLPLPLFDSDLNEILTELGKELGEYPKYPNLTFWEFWRKEK